MTDAQRKALVALVALALTGCVPRTACVDGKLYYRNGSDVLVRSQPSQECIEEKTNG